MSSELMNSEVSVHEKVPAMESSKEYKQKLVWTNIIIFLYMYLAAFYGLYILLFHAKIWTIIWGIAIGYFYGLGIAVGAHRLWAHKAFKAKWPLKLLLLILQTGAGQSHIYEWVRDHRMHHKFIDTNADPYNAKRGFFFSHVGWLLVRKHPDIITKGATLDCSDLEQDAFVVFQKKWYSYLLLLISFVIPIWIPCWVWGERLWCVWYLNIFRICVSLNLAWTVNSVAHIWGMKPLDKTITATNNREMTYYSFGEGWHNFHHVFPFDYKVPQDYGFNSTATFIEFFSYLGLAYDLKTVSPEVLQKRLLRNSQTN